MAKFRFALPDGKFFDLNGPDDATVAQAERIFLEQMAAGAFVGLRVGDTLQPPGEQLIKFSLSRLDRGTAAVDNLPLLAINNEGIITTLPLLGNVQIQNGITTADYTAQPTVTQSIGPLTATQIQAIKAQIAVAVDQPSSVITQEKGIGTYGLGAPQLEQTGYIKPGTSCRFMGTSNNPTLSTQPGNATVTTGDASRISIANPDNFVEVMNSPSVWTGKDGIKSLNDLLFNPVMQSDIQEQLISNSYNTLVETGEILTPATDENYPVGEIYTNRSSSSSAGLIQLASIGAAAYGTLSTLNLGAIGNTVSGTLSNLSSGIDNVLGKIGNINLDSISLGSLSSISLESVSGSLQNAVGSITSLANRGVAELGGLLSNAGKFGVGTATQWAKGLLPNGSLTSQLDGLAKQGQFAVNFSDFKLPTLVAGVAPAAAFKNTVNRQTVDLATSKIIGSNKIPTPSFGGTSIDDTVGNVTAQAKSLLAQNSSITGLVSQAQNLSTGLLNQAAGLAGTAAGALSGLSAASLPGVPTLAGLNSSLTAGLPKASALTAGLKLPNIGVDPGDVSKLGGSSLTNLIGTNTTDPNALAKWNTSFEAAVQDPNAPEYTGTDNVVRARLGLPPVDEDGNLLA